MNVGARTTIEDRMDRLAKAAERAAQGNIRAAAFLTQQDAQSTIQRAPREETTVRVSEVKRDKRGRFKRGSGKRKKTRTRRRPSAPGTPPHTKRGQLKRAIKYAATKDDAVIGPEYSKVGESGSAHEGTSGGTYKGDTYPARPFMFPALQRQAAPYGNSFAGSIGE